MEKRQTSKLKTLKDWLINIFVIVIIIVALTAGFTFIAYKMKDASIKLDEAIDFLERILSGKGGNILSLKDYETAIADSVEKLLEEAAKIKT